MIDEEKVKEWFATEVKERMEELDLRPYHMEYFCHIKHGCIYSYLRGANLPNLWSLVLMAERLDCSVNDLLGFEDPESYNVFEIYEASKMFGDINGYARCFADRLRRHLINRDMTVDDLSSLTGNAVTTIRVSPTLPSSFKYA